MEISIVAVRITSRKTDAGGCHTISGQVEFLIAGEVSFFESNVLPISIPFEDRLSTNDAIRHSLHQIQRLGLSLAKAAHTAAIAYGLVPKLMTSDSMERFEANSSANGSHAEELVCLTAV